MTQHSTRAAFTTTLAPFTTKRNDELNQMRQLLSIGKAALAADHFEDAQQNFTQLYADIQDKLLPACLALRAYTCQQQQEYVKGAALAEQYIHKRRHDADGYLLAGNMHVLSGDSDSALQVYRSGVQLSSHNHPRYPELVDETDHLEQQITRNTRLMRALPSDVIYATLSLLKWKDLAALASTCRVWHKFVLGWPGMWREITINNMNDLLPGHLGQQFLARAPPRHVRKLSFNADSDNAGRSKAYKEITRFNWNHLEELDIYCDETGDAHNYMERSDTAVSIIRNCKYTLKRLRLIHDRGRVLNYSMENCRNLERLIFENYRYRDEEYPVIMRAENSPLLRGQFRLPQLFIRCDRASLAIIEVLVSKCPYLEILRVLYDGGGLNNILRTLRSICPRLQTLEIESGKFAVLEPVRLTPLQQRVDNITRGLRDLTFNQDPEYFNEGLTALIHNSCHSLEILDVTYNPCVADVYKILAGTQMHNLRVLKCGYTGDDSSSVYLKTIIDAAPRLQDMYINAGPASDSVLAALGRRPNLTKLDFIVDEHVTYSGLDALFWHTPSLQQASVTYYGMRPGGVSICQLFWAISGCKPLRQLEIRTTNWRGDISDTEAQYLMEHIELQRPNLLKVTMSTFQGDTPEALILLWSKFKQLQHLSITISPFRPSIPWAQFASLVARIKIPGLKIEFNQRTETRIFQLGPNGNYYNGAMIM